MSRSERDVLEAMDRAVMDPPPMSLSPDAVVALGRHKVQRRRAVGAGMSIAAAAVAVTAWVGLSSGFDVVGYQIQPATTDPGKTLLVAEPTELSLREVGDQLELRDATGVVALVPKDMDGGQTILDGPNGLTYVVASDWPQFGRPVALAEDPRTGWTVPVSVFIDGQAPSGFIGAAVPPGPDGGALDVLTLADVTGDLPTCELTLPGQAGTPTRIGKLMQIANVRMLPDGKHWSACVVGDVFAGDLDRPVAQWHGNAVVQVPDWDSGFPDGLLTVVHEDQVDRLTPVWAKGATPIELDRPQAVTVGDDAVALDWSIPLKSLSGAWIEGLAGFDTDDDGEVDVPVLPLGANRTLFDGRAASNPFAPVLAPYGMVQVDDDIVISTGQEGDPELTLTPSDSPQIAAGPVGQGYVVAVSDLETASAEPGYHLLLQGPQGIDVIAGERWGTDFAGGTRIRAWSVSEKEVAGRQLLPALVTTDITGPRLTGGETRVVLRRDPSYLVTVHRADDLWVAQDGEDLVAGRLSDPGLPFEVDADGIPTSLRDD